MSGIEQSCVVVKKRSSEETEVLCGTKIFGRLGDHSLKVPQAPEASYRKKVSQCTHKVCDLEVKTDLIFFDAG